MKITGNFPVRTRLPIAAWVLAGIITLISLMHVPVTSDNSILISEQSTSPVKEAYCASVTDLLGILRALARV
jgi:hypothetical protein